MNDLNSVYVVGKVININMSIVTIENNNAGVSQNINVDLFHTTKSQHDFKVGMRVGVNGRLNLTNQLSVVDALSVTVL